MTKSSTRKATAQREDIEQVGARDRDDALRPGEKAGLEDQCGAERGDEHTEQPAAPRSTGP